jgi:hypothetical protein
MEEIPLGHNANQPASFIHHRQPAKFPVAHEFQRVLKGGLWCNRYGGR